MMVLVHLSFVLENVALGRNKFEAYAKSYQQDAAEEICMGRRSS